jgi:hypothetical protein
VYQDVVVKASFSKPVVGVNAETFTLFDSHGKRVPAWVDQIGDGTWGLFANQVLLKSGETYIARLKAGISDASRNRTSQDMVWKFTITKVSTSGNGDTSIPVGFPSEFAASWSSASPVAKMMSKAPGNTMRTLAVSDK